jgi:precorrin-6B methylase 1
MPRVGFELTTTVFEWAKTVRALHRAASVIGSYRHIEDFNPLDHKNEDICVIP